MLRCIGEVTGLSSSNLNFDKRSIVSFGMLLDGLNELKARSNTGIWGEAINN